MERVSWRRVAEVKAILSASADGNAIATTNNGIAHNQLRQRSGAGFLDARAAVDLARRHNHNVHTVNMIGGETAMLWRSPVFAVGPNTRDLRATLVFEQMPPGTINASTRLLQMRIRLWCTRRNIFVYTVSSAFQNTLILQSNNVSAGHYIIYVDVMNLSTASRHLTFSVARL